MNKAQAKKLKKDVLDSDVTHIQTTPIKRKFHNQGRWSQGAKQERRNEVCVSCVY
jgi:hypothetical protein